MLNSSSISMEKTDEDNCYFDPKNFPFPNQAEDEAKLYRQIFEWE
jgi:hypothetical protein